MRKITLKNTKLFIHKIKVLPPKIKILLFVIVVSLLFYFTTEKISPLEHCADSECYECRYNNHPNDFFFQSFENKLNNSDEYLSYAKKCEVVQKQTPLVFKKRYSGYYIFHLLDPIPFDKLFKSNKI